MNGFTYIGLVAATFTTIAFVPQIIRVWHLRETRDISLQMYLIYTLGIALWLTYGVLVGDIPLIAANSVTLVLAGTVLGFKIKYN